ncbi:MAG TPA: sulfatase [Candidatus Hydrogenedentes bacterium]|nr:sulfatase [Candidatus Hydrogenedentota bacterium]HOV74300.1 sulfatase [Candidatus Hydrogenedentota bacterium]HPC15007.1 sulfatase [Candidatus Hydrogenedentota bacterium]HRT19132.1 sulfatase [Candidatus Hydrogenedentota bacterium]HRT64061.1 sulfatase [Candidatus Hydrogenedentota bacterium]
MNTIGFLAVLAGAFAAPNVVLLSVDTLRADYLGCYGYPHPSSPVLDAFATEGLLFEDCVCEVPLTLPSFGCMFSGLYPRTTGTTKNGLRMPETKPLITEVFKKAGYQTFCVQSNWPLKGRLSGLDRGFDVYNDEFEQKRWGFMLGERNAEQVTAAGLEILGQRDPAKPFFLWIHYSDPHAPYEMHKKFNVLGQSPGSLEPRERVRAKYASEVAFTDYHIGRFLAALPGENTFVMFVADHGESLFEHNYLGHGRRIFQTNLHVPFILRGPGIAPGRSKSPVCVLDVAPTLLGMGGFSPLPGMEGRNVLLDPPGPSTVRHVETYGGAVPRLPLLRALLRNRGPQKRGIIHEGWKLIIGGGAHLFYLPEDPKESSNLARKHPERVAALRKMIDQWDKAHPRGKACESKLSAEDVEALRGLGYLY